jgi:hypothetical protein
MFRLFRRRKKPADLSSTPQRGILLLPSGQEVPLLPVYVGKQPRSDNPEIRADTWVLWVHPDWPEASVSVALSDGPPPLSIDVLPPNSQLILDMEIDGEGITVRRHGG